MPDLKPLETRFQNAWPPESWSDVTVLVAVSGGPDSMALLRLLQSSRSAQGAGRLVAAHFNHRLRADADSDERFVVDLCHELGIPVEIGHGDVAEEAANQGDGLESAARTKRYKFLQSAANKWGARYVATGHTADDQAETILHHIVRGTGLKGLGGIARVRRLSDATTLVRPLLGFHRAEIVEYLAAINQAYCEDPSNRDRCFTRNRIRHELLPAIQAGYNARVVDALVRLGGLAEEAQQVIEGLVETLSEQAVRIIGPNQVDIDCTQLVGQPRYLIRELVVAIWRRQAWPLQSMDFDTWNRVAELIHVTEGTIELPGAVRAIRSVSMLTLVRRQS